MNSCRLWLVTACLLFLLAFDVSAQKKKPAKKSSTQKSTTQKSKTQKPVQKTTKKEPVKKVDKSTPDDSVANSGEPDAAQDEKKVKDMVAFLEYMLNTLGSSETSARDKDVLVTQSYSKVFRDGKVQIEDDLDEERDVITNKDVIAYLKDVDFFFKGVKFEFTIDEIKGGSMTDGKLFYKVSLRRNLSGTNTDGKLINNTQPRYIEINFDPKDQDLKIVSIYTNEFNEKEALTNWWKELSYEWQSIFKRKLNLMDSVLFTDIKNITTVEELDLSHNSYIQTIDPLGQLKNLKLLNLSGTTVTDLSPIRNLTELVELDISNTKVQDLTPLKYASKLSRLNLNQTNVTDILVVEKMLALKNLELRATKVTEFKPIANLPELVYLNAGATQLTTLTPFEGLVKMIELNISSTPITDLNSLKGFKKLQILNIDSTKINNISVLSNLDSLKMLHANFTSITDLNPLQKLTRLERVYCDHTPIKREAADAFIVSNPKVLVIFDSKDLKAWWETLSPAWRVVFGKTANLGTLNDVLVSAPSKEDLAVVTNLDSINVGGNGSIHDLEALGKLLKLEVLILSKTDVKDLSPLKQHRQLLYLDISETNVSDLSVASQFTKLKELRADVSKIQNIEPLYGIKTLAKVYVDRTTIHDITAREFLEQNPTCLLIYKTIHLNRWWKGLSTNWKEIFRSQMAGDTTSTRENLHKLVERESFQFKDVSVNELTGLSEFVRLKELHFSGTGISDLSPLSNFRLKSLHATNSPIQRIESLTNILGLEDLDLSSTPVDDLKVIGSLQNLKTLNCSGTQIKKLSSLESLQDLENLDCSNTRVGSLDPVERLPLKTLKCYNTKVSDKDVKKFKERNPECNVVYYR